MFRQARDQYKACMDLDKLESIGLDPVKTLLQTLGGWPVLEAEWDESGFRWDETNYKFRDNGSCDLPFRKQCRLQYVLNFL